MYFIYKFYCPRITQLQVESTLSLLEKAMTQKHLNNTINLSGNLEAIPNRTQFLSKSMKESKRIPLLINGTEKDFVRFSGYQLNFIEEIWYIIIEIDSSITPLKGHEDILLNVSVALNSHWSTMNTNDTERTTSLQLQLGEYNNEALSGLPRLNGNNFTEHPEIPVNLAWLNYWSKNAAEKAGLNAINSAAGYIHKYERVPSGWFAKLTSTPLNLLDKNHKLLISRLYDEFPLIINRH